MEYELLGEESSRANQPSSGSSPYCTVEGRELVLTGTSIQEGGYPRGVTVLCTAPSGRTVTHGVLQLQG